MTTHVSAEHALSEHIHHQDEEEHNRSGERRTKWVVIITFVMMIGELTIGHLTGSMALTADGWHMGTHVGALGLTLVAYWYARTRAGHDAFSFGTGKVYALAGYTSGVLLTIVALWLAYEGIDHLVRREVPDYLDALPVAAVGLVVNFASAMILGSAHHYGHAHGHAHGHDHGHAHGHDHGHAHGHDHGHHDHHDHHHTNGNGHARAASHDDHDAHKPKPGTLDFNLRAAYIHILADAMTSLLAIIALVLGYWMGLWFLDALMGLVGGAVIVWWAASLCRQASRQLLDVVSSPSHERLVRQKLEAIDDVRVADLHVWELGPGRRSCIVSLVTTTPRDVAFYRDTVLAALPVAHLTIEIHQCALAHAGGDPCAEVAHAHEH